MYIQSKPVVSVIMAVKDGERYLRQAVDSILQQTFRDFEFIIINDCSTDGSMNILNEYTDRRIRIYSNEENIGLTRSLNIALGYCRCEYVARMDADDICLPDRFNMQVDFLNAHPDVSVVGTGFMMIEEDGTPISEKHFPTDDDLIRWALCFYNPIVHPSVMMRLSTVKQVGGYDPTLAQSQDYDLWWRLSFISKLANLEPICVLLRQHSRQITSVYRNNQFEQGTKIDQRHLSYMLGKPISEDTIRKLWFSEFANPGDALAACKLILDYSTIVLKHILSSTQRTMVKRDAKSRIQSIMTQFARNQSWYMFLRRFFSRKD